MVDTFPCPKKRLLIACDRLVLTGGLLRFERVGRVYKSSGCDVSYACFSAADFDDFNTQLTVYTIEQAAELTWDAVMVPGAGFPDDTIEGFSIFNSECFGVRVQHVLNDQSRLDRFLHVNRVFRPHVVIFNNYDWPVGSFTSFRGDRFHILLGAVDSNIFKPKPYRNHAQQSDRWIIGGQARKNPEPLIQSLEYLPPNTFLRLFGEAPAGLTEKYSDMIADGRLELIGSICNDEKLAAYYHSVDCIVMTETCAGWSNLVAEAMASGVPVVCTYHGTRAFAEDNQTALMLVDLLPESIAGKVTKLMENADLCQRLACNARTTISLFSWDQYAKQLLKLIDHDGIKHYICSPEDGLFGKWLFEDRLNGLDYLLQCASGLSVLDLGAAEGLIAREFLRRGAGRVRGFEIDVYRVRKANALCAGWSDVGFRTADLSDWHKFAEVHDDCLHHYDIVLYLGIHHHLPPHTRMDVLRHAAELAVHYLAVRTTEELYVMDNIDSTLSGMGFAKLNGVDRQAGSAENLGIIQIYERSGEMVC